MKTKIKVGQIWKYKFEPDILWMIKAIHSRDEDGIRYLIMNLSRHDNISWSYLANSNWILVQDV